MTPPTLAWAIEDPDGNLIMTTCMPSEEQCKSAYAMYVDWSKFEAQGYHCVPVEIRRNLSHPTPAWAIKAPDGIILSSVRSTKGESQETCGGFGTWRELEYDCGYRCVRVEIREVG